MNPYNTRFPIAQAQHPEQERRAAQVQDPYPDETFGPETGFRPLDFQTQRAEPLRAKDRYHTAVLRNQNNGWQTPSPQPLFAPQSMMVPQPGAPRGVVQYQTPYPQHPSANVTPYPGQVPTFAPTVANQPMLVPQTRMGASTSFPQ